MKNSQEFSMKLQGLSGCVELYSKVQQYLDKLFSELDDYELRQDLLAKLISTKNSDPGVGEYYRLLHTEFMPFTNKLSVLSDELVFIAELEEIGKELKLVSANPDFYQRHNIAIAGGFSTGKSTFISSLFKQKEDDKKKSVRLPIGIDPTTAIPTYVLHSDKLKFFACNNEGGVIDLLENKAEERKIEFIQKLTTHQFLESFGFKLQDLMPFLFLSTPLRYENLCFIDTPGYNPAKFGTTDEDNKIAKEFVDNADVLIWVIAVDSSGTISDRDIEFLNDILEENENKQLYIVLNKADLRSQSNLEDVIDEIEEQLEDEGINFEGISAYSSNTNCEILYRKMSLLLFLDRLDAQKISSKYGKLKERLIQVRNKYYDAIFDRIIEDKEKILYLNELDLNLLGEELNKEQEILSIIHKMRAFFEKNVKYHQKFLTNLDDIILKMNQEIDNVFKLGCDKSIKLTERSINKEISLKSKEVICNLPGTGSVSEKKEKIKEFGILLKTVLNSKEK